MAFDTEGRCHHGNCSSMRCAEQIEVGDSQSICELQHALGSSSHGAVHSLGCDGQSGAEVVDGVKGGMRRDCRDRAVSFRSAEPLRQNFRDSRLVAFKDVGHLPYEEAPEEFNRELIKFLVATP